MPRLEEFPTRSGELVAIEALIKLPKLEPGFRFRLEQAAQNAVKMTSVYGRRDITRVLAPGYRFRIDQLADSLRIGLTVEPKDIGSGLSVLSSVLTQPSFLPEAIKVETSPSVSPWRRATRAYDTVPMEIDQALLQDIWRYVVQPSNITVGVRGPFLGGQARALWQKREQYWAEYLPSKSIYGRSPKLKLEIGEPPILLLSKRISAPSANDLLDATLLGGGKDSILWRVCREQLRMSYQQDAFLIPTEAGWEFRVAIAADKSILEEGAIARVQAALMASVEKLTVQDMEHAKGLLRGYFEFGQPGVPIILGTTAVTTGDENDRLFRDLYFASKNVSVFDVTSWATLPSLEATKIRLKTLLESSAVSFR